MSWTNAYTAPPLAALDEPYGPDPYDINFFFPLNPDALENDRAKLVPFVPRQHMQHLFDVSVAHPELYRYLPIPTPSTIDELLASFELRFRRTPGECMFVIVDKTRTPPAGSAAAAVAAADDFGRGAYSYAGILGLINSSREDLFTEIGFIVVFPDFQRTHVLSNAVGLLLQFTLNLPSEVPAGLGLRRVFWMANERNEPSVKAAQRMGMRMEGVLRWHRVLPEGKEGDKARDGDPREANLARHSAMLSICWDDWVSGGKEKVQAVMARTS